MVSRVGVLLVFLLAAGIVRPLMATTPAPELAWELVSRRPHDASAFTQGLELGPAGRLFESTGIRGSSTVREVDPSSGEVLRRRDLPPEHFGEGITLVGDRLLGLTYRAGVATAYAVDTFEPLERFAYAGEGWGLCFDGERLVMSDGSDHLTFRDAATFEVLDTVAVTLDGEPLTRLNELECVDDSVWANVWRQDIIVRIDPGLGEVTGVLDIGGIVEPYPPDAGADVLNGIAYDATSDTFLVTGKYWPELFEIRLLDEPAPRAEG
jgi:glutamine cyclotransferase